MSVIHNETSLASFEIDNKESEVSKAAAELCSYTEELKCQILSASDAEMCDGNKLNGNYKPENITGADNRQVVRKTFFSEEGEGKAKILKEKVSTFREIVLASKNISPELIELTKTLFDTGENDINSVYPEGLSWEQREFNNYSLIFTLDFLSKLQSNVRLVEAEALN